MGHNSPFLGWELGGRVTHTLIDGKIVYTYG
jgi:dihydroorotase-like cyclic amidohydrolase